LIDKNMQNIDLLEDLKNEKKIKIKLNENYYYFLLLY
jgi:hypothetical protein